MYGYLSTLSPISHPVVLDRASIRYLWRIAPMPGHRVDRPSATPTPVLHRLLAQGLIGPDGELSDRGWRLCEPLASPERVLRLTRIDTRAAHRRIWIAGPRAVIADPLGSDASTFTEIPIDELGRQLVTWLGIRPLPAPPDRRPRPCRPTALTRRAEEDALGRGTESPVDLTSRPPRDRRRLDVDEDDATTWVITESTDGHLTRRLTALDGGREGWWLAGDTHAPDDDDVLLHPCDVAAVHVAVAAYARTPRSLLHRFPR